MAVVPKATLKEYFEDGKLLLERHYVDLIDTMGDGDMQKTDYDSNDDGIVDDADMVSEFGLGTAAKDVSGGDWDDIKVTGFYRGQTMSNAPRGRTHWHYVLVIQHGASYCIQEAIYYYATVPEKHIRRYSSGAWQSWEQIFPADWDDIVNKPTTFSPASHQHGGSDITSAVDEADNADTVDNLQASQFVRSDANDSKTGSLSMNSDLRMDGGLTVGSQTDLAADGHITFTEQLISRKSGTSHEVRGLKLDRITSSNSRWTAGTPHSTDATRRTLDWSSDFSGVPDNCSAVFVRIAIRDSGGASGQAVVYFSETTTMNQGAWIDVPPANSRWARGMLIIPCTDGGLSYFNVIATGSNTVEIIMSVEGYFI